MRIRILVALLALASVLAVPTPSGADILPEPAYLTLQVGRGLAGFCFDSTFTDPRVVRIDQLGAELGARHLPASAVAILDWTHENDRYCRAGRQYSSWADYKQLQMLYGWNLVSGGYNHTHLAAITSSSTLATRQADWDDTCGSLLTFRAHGFAAKGFYAYAGGPSVDSVQQSYVSKCFSYGRKYSTALNTRTKMTSPWYQTSKSLNGGRCNDPSASCYNTPATNLRYLMPSALAALMNPAAGQWASIQVYNLVRGTRVGEGGESWDCSELDPARHWTDRTEIYCADDFLSAVDQRSPTAVVTTPLKVAEAWGRGSPPGTPRPS